MAWSPSSGATTFAALVVSELADQGVTAATSLVAKAVYDALQSVGVGLLAVLSRSSSFTAAPGTYYRINATTGNITVTLPASSSSSGQQMIFKRVDASGNTITLTRTGGDLIDGATTKAIVAQYDVVRLIASSAGWDVI